MNESLTGEELAILDAVVGDSIGSVPQPAHSKSRTLALLRDMNSLDGMKALPGTPGVTTRVIARDQAKRTRTVLLHFARGAALPGHRHRGHEQAYVVKGSCRIDDQSLAAGEFHHIEPGTRHGDVVSDSGCVLLVTTDDRDYRAAWMASIARLFRWSRSPLTRT